MADSRGLLLRELGPGITVEQIRLVTGTDLNIADDLNQIPTE